MITVIMMTIDSKFSADTLLQLEVSHDSTSVAPSIILMPLKKEPITLYFIVLQKTKQKFLIP